MELLGKMAEVIEQRSEGCELTSPTQGQNSKA